MKTLILVFFLLVSLLDCFGAAITEFDFRGAGTATVTSNTTTHKVTITGTGIQIQSGSANSTTITNGTNIGTFTVQGTGALFITITPSVGQAVSVFKGNDTNGNANFQLGTNNVLFSSGTNNLGLSASNNATVPGRSADLAVSNTPAFRLFNDGTSQALGALNNSDGNTVVTNGGNISWQTGGVVIATSPKTINFTTGVTGSVSSGTMTVGVSAIGSGSQTPWTSDISGGGNSLSNVSHIGIGLVSDPGIGLVGLGGFIFSNSATPNFVYWTNGQMTIASTNQPGYSNYLAGYVLTLSNSFAAPTNTHQDIGLRMFGSTYLTGAGFGVATPSAEMLWSPTIAAPPAAGTWVWQTRTNITGVPTTNMTLTSAGTLTTAAGITTSSAGISAATTVTAVSGFTYANGFTLYGAEVGKLNLAKANASSVASDFYGITFGGIQQSNGLIQFISSSTGNSNGTINLRSGNTNSWINLGVGSLAASNSISLTNGALIVGPSGASITNILAASATLDFPSTAAGGVSDLPITVTGAADGDVVKLGVPSGSITSISGDYFAWASNGVVYVRFANNNLVSAQDPASGTFKVIVTKF